jgi:hypothetical protein
MAVPSFLARGRWGPIARLSTPRNHSRAVRGRLLSADAQEGGHEAHPLCDPADSSPQRTESPLVLAYSLPELFERSI